MDATLFLKIPEPAEVDKSKNWSQYEALIFCQKLESVVAMSDHHIAMTGGCLFKEGLRKDLDIILYSVRQSVMNRDLVFANLEKQLGLVFIKIGNWQSKAVTKDGKFIDFLIPEYVKSTEDDYTT